MEKAVPQTKCMTILGSSYPMSNGGYFCSSYSVIPRSYLRDRTAGSGTRHRSFSTPHYGSVGAAGPSRPQGRDTRRASSLSGVQQPEIVLQDRCRDRYDPSQARPARLLEARCPRAVRRSSRCVPGGGSGRRRRKGIVDPFDLLGGKPGGGLLLLSTCFSCAVGLRAFIC